ncbi:hypothetical protein HBI56_038970 [Parastagonospora nodorum]|nr:hypothetical protein HBH53_014120 [Parastagonospora nodorum]KAH3988326.1 hypothetical protein HBH51_003760 [Parastagonospora nodorum]KAH4004677.1 hypothetical protein HBI10_042260 [Parastagonospora nodorum]KAH4030853.1 hypothetical protein HBI13_025710 [Parastagonospora nodorum]KAH4040412.1 hypothetical protein HBI09_027650 [Parastagonospora nodorum]
MRYIRFLKPPRVVTVKGTSKQEISCLVTITSDLGDTFLPHDIQLSAELLSDPSEKIVVWRTVQWSAGMRTLPVTFPLVKTRTSSKLRVRVGFGSKLGRDEYNLLSEDGACGVVSAWSSIFEVSVPTSEAEKLVQRRFRLPDGSIVVIYEETGESIARHLWDAGITLSCHLNDLCNSESPLTKALLPSGRPAQCQILELGTGCGMVGITIAQLLPGAEVRLTDLPEAQEIVKRNIHQARPAEGSSLEFQTLDWDAELPLDLQRPTSPMDLVIAADCTYNSDSSPALVETLSRLAKVSPKVLVAIAMKMRHPSEEIFFDLMAAAGFQPTARLDYPLPGDLGIGEEMVYLHVYQYKPSL